MIFDEKLSCQFVFVGLFVAASLTTAIYPKAKLIQSDNNQKIYIPNYAIRKDYERLETALTFPSRCKYKNICSNRGRFDIFCKLTFSLSWNMCRLFQVFCLHAQLRSFVTVEHFSAFFSLFQNPTKGTKYIK